MSTFCECCFYYFLSPLILLRVGPPLYPFAPCVSVCKFPNIPMCIDHLSGLGGGRYTLPPSYPTPSLVTHYPWIWIPYPHTYPLWILYPPPPPDSLDRMTDARENTTFPQVRWQSVKNFITHDLPFTHFRNNFVPTRDGLSWWIKGRSLPYC